MISHSDRKVQMFLDVGLLNLVNQAIFNLFFFYLFFIVIIFVDIFKTGSHYVAVTGLELIM